MKDQQFKLFNRLEEIQHGADGELVHDLQCYDGTAAFSYNTIGGLRPLATVTLKTASSGYFLITLIFYAFLIGDLSSLCKLW